MDNLRQRIIEASLVGNVEKFRKLLRNTISVNNGGTNETSTDLTGRSKAQLEVALQVFLRGLDECFNGVKKSQLTKAALQTLDAVFTQLQFELTEQELMTLWAIRDKTKFRMREEEVLKMVTEEFKDYPGFDLDKKSLGIVLREMKNDALTTFRRKSVTIEDNVVAIITL